MAQIFGGCSRPPSKDILVKETPVRINDEPACTNENISGARDLLSYYQFHVRNIENLLNHHEEVEQKFNSAEQELRAAQTDLKEAQHDLAHTRKELGDSRRELGDTKKQLENTRHELGDNRKKLESTRKDLGDARSELGEVRKQLESTRKELGNTRRRLDSTTKELGDTKSQLESTRKELGDKSRKLDTARQELGDTKKQLEVTRKELGESKKQFEVSRKELGDTKSQLQAALGDLRQTNDKLKTTETKLEQAIKENAETLEVVNELNGQIEGLKAKLKKANDGEDEALAKSSLLQKEKDAAEAEVDKLKQELSNTKLAKAASFLHQANRSSGKYYIDEVVYGGKVIEDTKVINDLLKCAVENKSFEVNNLNCGGDPWKGTTKSFTVAYTIDGKGPFKYINGKEYKTVKFERN